MQKNNAKRTMERKYIKRSIEGRYLYHRRKTPIKTSTKQRTRTNTHFYHFHSHVPTEDSTCFNLPVVSSTLSIPSIIVSISQCIKYFRSLSITEIISTAPSSRACSSFTISIAFSSVISTLSALVLHPITIVINNTGQTMIHRFMHYTS